MVKLMQKGERLIQGLLAFVAIAFLISGLVYLYGGRWTVTLQDYWIIYDTCLNHSWLQSALTKVNHQPVFFPSLIWLADLRFAHGNQELLFFAGILFLGGTTALLLIPFWREKAMSLTVKLEITLVMIVANFWMARAAITTSGGFNCICSLAMGGALAAILCLGRHQSGSAHSIGGYLALTGFAFLASFSFGTGFAVWPALLVLGWTLRLPLRSLGVILAGGIVATVVYFLLPGQSGTAATPLLASSLFSKIATMLHHLCMLIGAPLLYAQAAWSQSNVSRQLVATSGLSVLCGAMGLACASLVIGSKVLRREAPRSSSQVVVGGVLLFNLFVLVIIVLGRAEHFRSLPSEVAAPRYLFWSSFFWAGLMLELILAAATRKWLRWPVLVLVIALPVLAFPLHYLEGLHWRHARYRAEMAATGLMNDVRDPKHVKILFREPNQVYRLAPILRAARLDMFSAGYQDWIGRPQTTLFGGHHTSNLLRGSCSVEALVSDADGNPAARVIGRGLIRENSIPRILVMVDADGVICGIGRSWVTTGWVDRIFYGSRASRNDFLGYIRDYDPERSYFVRSADNGTLSDEQIVVKGL